MSRYAWVTLATNDSYSLGALVLAHSLKRVSTAHQLAILITPTVSESMRNKLKDVFNIVQEVNVLDSQDAANLALLARPELGITFTKIHCWRLIQFEKCVFLDADTLVLQNCDELFEREELSAAPDVGWPDCFNSGVFVFRPNLETFAKITQFALEKGSFDGGDQGLLNSFFSDWATSDISKHLPFLYNTCSTATYSYLPAFKQFADRIKILHFIGQLKPWLLNFNTQNKTVYTPQEYGHLHMFLQFWWDLFCDNVHSNLTDDMNYNTRQIDNHTSNEYQNQYNIIDRDEFHTEVIFNIVIRDPWEDYYENLEKDKVSNYVHIEENNSNPNINNNYSNNQDNYFDNNYSNNCNNNTNNNWNDNHTNDSHQNVNYDNNWNSNYTEYVQSDQNTVTRNAESNFNTNTSSDAGHYDNNQNPHHTDIQSVPNVQPDYSSQESRNIHSEQSSYNVSDNKSVFSEHEHRSEEKNFSNLKTSAESDNNTSLKANDIQSSNDNNKKDLNSNSTAESETEGGLAAALSKVRLGEERTPEQEAYEQHIRRQCWESGNIDYSGRDSFDNIWRKISQTLSSGPKAAEPKPPQEPGRSKSISPVVIQSRSSSRTRSPRSRIRLKSTNRLTSADIQDGKVELDKKTGIKTTYKLIDGGFQKTIETPQPNGTMKIETQTFYDPKPLTDEEIEMANKPEGTYKKGNVTTVVKKIPGGKQLTITTKNADGTETVQTQTVYEATEEEITEITETEQKGGNKKKVVSKKVPGGTAFDDENKKKIVHEDSTTTEEVSVKSKRTVEESRRLTETTEVSGKATKTTKKQSKAIEGSDTPAIENKPKKSSKPKKCPLPDDFVEKPGEKTTLEKRRVESGTEYIFTTVLADGRVEVTRKTVQEEEGVDMDEDEIEEYNRQLKEAEKYKNLKKTKKITTEYGTKTIMPADKEGEVTTVETIKIDGGTEYHYTTVCADGTVKKSTKTLYDKVQVEGSEEEYEEVEEYEEEIIEPGEPIVETIETIKTITAEEKRLTSSQIEDGKVEYDKKTGIRKTYKKITNGYQITIETPQPNGTMKTETKTFYDPRPVTKKDKDDDNDDDDDDTPKKTPQKDSKALVPKKAPGALAMNPSTTNRTIVHQGSTTTREEIHVRSQRTVEETRHYTQTSTEVTEKKKLGQDVHASNGDAPKKKGKKAAAK